MIKWILFETKHLLFKKKSLVLLVISVIFIAVMAINENKQLSKTEDLTIMQYEREIELERSELLANNTQPMCKVNYSRYLIDMNQFYEDNIEFDEIEILTESQFEEMKQLNCPTIDTKVASEELYEAYQDKDRTQFALKELTQSSYVLFDINRLPEERIDEFFGSHKTYEYYKSIYTQYLTFSGIDDSMINNEFFTIVDQVMINYPAIKTKILVDSLSNDLPLIREHELTPATAILYYFQYYGVFIVLVSLIIGFDSVYSDIEDGSIKTILSSPFSRYRYFVVKSSSILIVTLMITLLPILILGLCLGLVQGFDSFKTRTFGFTNGFKQIFHTIKYSGNNDSYMSSYFDKVESVGLLAKVPTFITMLGDSGKYPIPLTHHLSDISLGMMIAANMFLILLLDIFLISINQLTSIMFKSKERNLIGLITIVVIGLGCFFVFGGKYVNMLNPFSFMNPQAVVQGIVPFTYLNAVLTLSIYIVGLNLICKKLLEKVDIST